MEKKKGAGILPLALHKGSPYILVGRETSDYNEGFNDRLKWSDFGGASHAGESFVEFVFPFLTREPDISGPSLTTLLPKSDVRILLLRNPRRSSREGEVIQLGSFPDKLIEG